MYLLKRITKVPDSPLKILVDQPQGDGDAGLGLGGSFYFMPAGQEGDTYQVMEGTARTIMGDPSLAVHFECTPPVPGLGPAEQEPEAEPAGGPAAGGKRRGRG